MSQTGPLVLYIRKFPKNYQLVCNWVVGFMYSSHINVINPLYGENCIYVKKGEFGGDFLDVINNFCEITFDCHNFFEEFNDYSSSIFDNLIKMAEKLTAPFAVKDAKSFTIDQFDKGYSYSKPILTFILQNSDLDQIISLNEHKDYSHAWSLGLFNDIPSIIIQRSNKWAICNNYGNNTFSRDEMLEMDSCTFFFSIFMSKRSIKYNSIQEDHKQLVPIPMRASGQRFGDDLFSCFITCLKYPDAFFNHFFTKDMRSLLAEYDKIEASKEPKIFYYYHFMISIYYYVNALELMSKGDYESASKYLIFSISFTIPSIHPFFTSTIKALVYISIETKNSDSIKLKPYLKTILDKQYTQINLGVCNSKEPSSSFRQIKPDSIKLSSFIQLFQKNFDQIKTIDEHSHICQIEWKHIGPSKEFSNITTKSTLCKVPIVPG